MTGPRQRTPRPPIEEWPWYKNPFLWAFVVGIILLTMLRPCTRYEPEPLPSLGQIPSWLAPDEPLAQEIALVLFAADGCARCDEAIEGTLYVMRRLERSDLPIDVIIYYEEGTDLTHVRNQIAYESRVTLQPIEVPDDWYRGSFERVAASGQALPQKWSEFLQIGSVWILDQRHDLRGPLEPFDTDGRSELFYRTQHVIYALRANKDKDS